MSTPIPVVNGNTVPRVDIIWRRGTKLEFYSEHYSDDDQQVPRNIMANTYRCDVVDKKTGKAVLSFGMGSGFSVSDTNRLNWLKSKVEMRVPAGGIYDYDVEEIETGKDVQYGEFTIIDDKTKT